VSHQKVTGKRRGQPLFGIWCLLGGFILTLRLTPACGQSWDERSPLDNDPNAPLVTIEDEVPYYRAGSFRVLPSATLVTGYDSNVFATDRDRSQDSISIAQALVQASNDSEVWGLTGTAFARARRFINTADADTNEYGFSTTLDANPTPQDEWFGQFLAQRRFESRTDAETPTDIPVSYYNEYRASIAEQHTFNRFTTRVTLGARDLDYVDSTQDYRQRWTYTSDLRGTYQLRSGFSLLADGIYTRDDFARPDPRIDSASTTGALFGTHIEFREIVDLELSAGPLKRNYAGDRGSLSGLSITGSLAWEPTRLTTIRGEVTRDDEATTVAGVLGKFRTDVGIQVDHMYSPAVTLYARVRVIFDDYVSIGRTDTTQISEAGMDILMSRNYVFRLSYEYGSRHSYVAVDAFQRHIATISLTRRL
jgi:hypothetical protein